VGVVAEYFAQLKDGAGQDFVGNVRFRPHALEQLFAGDHFPRLLGEGQQHEHNLGL
jgi:hypothetical protein